MDPDPDSDQDPHADQDPAIFVIDLPKMPTKNQFKKKSFFAYYFLRYMYIIFKDKKSKRSHEAVGIKVILTFILLGDRRIKIWRRRRIRIRIHQSEVWIRIRIQEVQKHVDLVDPDPDSDAGSATLEQNRTIRFIIISKCSFYKQEWTYSRGR
jgi:hypothetical protein